MNETKHSFHGCDFGVFFMDVIFVQVLAKTSRVNQSDLLEGIFCQRRKDEREKTTMSDGCLVKQRIG